MDKVTVFRIQHRTRSCLVVPARNAKAGPYSSGFLIGRQLSRVHSWGDELHSPPSWGLMTRDVVCGVEDYDELDHWFGGWYGRLKFAGFELTRWSVAPWYAVRSNQQTVFNDTYGTLEQHLSIDHLIARDRLNGRTRAITEMIKEHA